MTCSECGADTSLTREGGPQAHQPWCSLRGAGMTSLTLWEGNKTAWVASCRDGHEFWEGDRREGEYADQELAAKMDVLVHNQAVHPEAEALRAAYDEGWHAPVYENRWAPEAEQTIGEDAVPHPVPELAPVVDIKKAANAKRAETDGTPGIFLSRLWLDGAYRNDIQPVIRVGEEDGGWWFYLPDSWPAADWRGDIRWFNQDGAIFMPGATLEEAEQTYPFGSAKVVTDAEGDAGPA